MNRISDYANPKSFHLVVEWTTDKHGMGRDEKVFLMPTYSTASILHHSTVLANYAKGHPDKKIYVSDFGNPGFNRHLAKFLIPLQECENVALPSWVWTEWAKPSEPEEPKTKLDELSQKLAKEQHEQTPQFNF